MKVSTIKKWGNGLGILLPKSILEMVSLKDNDEVDIKVENNKIVLCPVKKKRLTLSERFADFEGDTVQSEFWTNDIVGKEEI